MLHRHDGDADIDVGAADAQPRGAVLRQPAFGNIEIGDDLDARNHGLRQHAGRRRHRPQQAVDTHANHEPGLKRLDMNVAGAQLDGFFQQIVDGANHRRAARKVAQALDVVFARNETGPPHPRLGIVFAKAAIEHDLEIFDRSNRDRDVPAEHDFGGALRRPVGRIGNRQSRISVGGLIGEDRHLPQKPLRERLVERRRRQQLLKRHALEAGKAGRFVGKIAAEGRSTPKAWIAGARRPRPARPADRSAHADFTR